MSKARQLADLGNQVDDGAITGSNMVINGGMTVAQRGVSLSLSNATEYLVDRFRTYKNHSATATVSQSSDAPDGFTNSWLITVGTGAATSSANELQLAQTIEGYNASVLALGTSGAKTFTISFWVKSSLTGTFAFGLQSQSAVDNYVATYSISSANTWEHKTVTIQGHTGGSWNTTNGAGIGIVFDLGGGSNFETTTGVWSTGNKYTTSGATKVAGTSGATWQITGVCLNVGDSAIAFPHESYGETLAKCQRYYFMLASGDEKSMPTGSYYLSTLVTMPVQFPVTMRSAPSLDSPTGTDYYGIYRAGAFDNFTSFSGIGRSSVNGITLDSNGRGASGTVGHSGPLKTDKADAYVAFDAEL